MFELLYMRYSLCWGEDQRYGVGHLVKYISTLGLPELHKKADYMYMLYIFCEDALSEMKVSVTEPGIC